MALSLIKGIPIALIYNKQEPETFKVLGKGNTNFILLRVKIDEDEIYQFETYSDENVKLENNIFTIINPKLKLQPLPRMVQDQSDRIVVLGSAGSGKSTFIANWATQFRYLTKNKKIKNGNGEIVNNHPIVLFSRHSKDKSIDVIKDLIRIPLDESILTHPFDLDTELKGTLVIMDDIESQNKLLTKALYNLRDDISQNGRKYDINLCSAIHQTDYKNTRLLLTEATQIVIFPKGGGKSSTHRVLKQYAGLNEKEIKTIFELRSRWVVINLLFPRYIMYEKGVYMI